MHPSAIKVLLLAGSLATAGILAADQSAGPDTSAAPAAAAPAPQAAVTAVEPQSSAPSAAAAAPAQPSEQSAAAGTQGSATAADAASSAPASASASPDAASPAAPASSAAPQSPAPATTGSAGNGAAMGEGGPEGAAMGEGGEGGSEPSGQLRAWQEKLGLSDDQVARIKAVRAAHRRASRELAGKVRRDVQNLRDMVESGSSDSELSAAISTLKQDREAQRREREALSDDLGAVFTPAQDARYILEMSGRQESPGGMGRKGGAGAGGLP